MKSGHYSDADVPDWQLCWGGACGLGRGGGRGSRHPSRDLHLPLCASSHQGRCSKFSFPRTSWGLLLRTWDFKKLSTRLSAPLLIEVTFHFLSRIFFMHELRSNLRDPIIGPPLLIEVPFHFFPARVESGSNSKDPIIGTFSRRGQCWKHFTRFIFAHQLGFAL